MVAVQPRFELCERSAELGVREPPLLEHKDMPAAQHELILVKKPVSAHVEHPVQLVPTVAVVGEIESWRGRQGMYLGMAIQSSPQRNRCKRQ